MDLIKAIETYVAVIEAGSLVAAADKLDTSTAAVSRHVAGLERHLGVRVLNRTTRRLSMTDTGRDLYSRAQQILADVADMEASIGQAAVNPTGTLRISAPLSLGIAKFGQWLPGFMTRYPDLKLDIDLTDRVADLASDGLDVAVRIARQPATTNVIASRIAPVEMIACASPEYLRRRGVPKTPGDLAGHDTLAYSYLSSGDSWTLTSGSGEATTVRIHPKVHATNGDVLGALAVAGFGIIAQPTFIVEKDIAAGRLIPILQGWRSDGFSLYAIYLSRAFLSAKVRVFIDHLRDVARQN
jgi:DNA-binding transcriptional LysR family regulator